MPKTVIARSLAIILAVCWCISASSAVIYLKVFDFNDSKALDRWGNMILNGRVKYMLMNKGNNGYIEALSEKTCSALYYRMGFKLKDYPILTWKWRVLRFPDLSKTKTGKERDDYAARVYVIFPFLNFSTSKFIEYIWAEDIPDGTIMTSPKANNVKQIVVRSGKVEEGQWVVERRNVYDDYIKAFGKSPHLSAGAIAIMCNADNTQTVAESIFDDITIGKE